MDPKLSNLDPKLQDAYNRVMNGSGPAPAYNPNANNPASPPPVQSTPLAQNPNPQPIKSAPPPPAQPPANNTQPPNEPPPIMLTTDTNVPPPQPTAGSSSQQPAVISQQDPSYYSPPTADIPSDPTPPLPAPDLENVQPIQQFNSKAAAPPAPQQPTEQAQTQVPAPPNSFPPQPIQANANPAVSGTTVAFNADHNSKNVGTTPVKKNGLRMLPLVVGLGVLLLLVVYTVVWILVFNVEVPFIPQI